MTDAIEKAIEALQLFKQDIRCHDFGYKLDKAEQAIQALREHKAKQTEGVTEALKFFEKLYDKEVRGLENHSHFDPTYEQRQNYVVSFHKYITTIRQALTQGDGDE